MRPFKIMQVLYNIMRNRAIFCGKFSVSFSLTYAFFVTQKIPKCGIYSKEYIINDFSLMGQAA